MNNSVNIIKKTFTSNGIIVEVSVDGENGVKNHTLVVSSKEELFHRLKDILNREQNLNSCFENIQLGTLVIPDRIELSDLTQDEKNTISFNEQLDKLQYKKRLLDLGVISREEYTIELNKIKEQRQ